jgi:hypothetical protein
MAGHGTERSHQFRFFQKPNCGQRQSWIRTRSNHKTTFGVHFILPLLLSFFFIEQLVPDYRHRYRSRFAP